MIICCGGFGCKTASRIPERTVAVGAKLDMKYAPDDATKYVVNVGSDTGAHRDHRRAARQLRRSGNAEKVREIINEVKRLQRPPVLVFGLCGATGLAVARRVLDEVPGALVIALPHPNEPEAGLAVEKWDFLTGSAKFGNSVIHALTPAGEYDAETLERAAMVAEKAERRYRDVDVLVNHARKEYHYLDGKRTDVAGIANAVRTSASGVPKVEVRARSRRHDDAVPNLEGDRDDDDGTGDNVFDLV